MNRQRIWKAVGMAIGVLVLVSSLQLYGQQAEAGAEAAAKAATYVVFDVPGSTCEGFFPFCTTPVAINPAKTVTGFYADTNGALHGFVRASDGTITTFDGPGATCVSPLVGSFTCTVPVGINPAGTITGFYCDAVTCHSFLRAPDGTFTPFDPPGSVLAAAFLPPAGGINPAGAITGGYADVNFQFHGFLRAPDGTFTAFDSPGAVNGTFPSAINPAGTITGNYEDANFVSHGFVRATDGTITTFDLPGSSFTVVTSITPAGAIVGSYQDAITLFVHGFLRAADGTFTTFDPPGSIQTGVSAINAAGEIVGNALGHGFLRAKDGAFTVFEPPGAVTGFTNALAINPAGVITGWYCSTITCQGFLRIP